LIDSRFRQRGRFLLYEIDIHFENLSDSYKGWVLIRFWFGSCLVDNLACRLDIVFQKNLNFLLDDFFNHVGGFLQFLLIKLLNCQEMSIKFLLHFVFCKFLCIKLFFVVLIDNVSKHLTNLAYDRAIDLVHESVLEFVN
jgi:hypothetical protein